MRARPRWWLAWWCWCWCACAGAATLQPEFASAACGPHLHALRAALPCAALAPLALVARLRSASADRRTGTFQVRHVLRAQLPPPQPNDTLRVPLGRRGRAQPLRVDSVYLLLADRPAKGQALRLLEPPLLHRCLPKGFRAHLRKPPRHVVVGKHQCKANEEFKECGTKCPATCDNRQSCTRCIPGCFCKSGFYKEQGECVHNSKPRTNHRGNPRLDIKARDLRVLQGKSMQLTCKLSNIPTVPTHNIVWIKDNRRLAKSDHHTVNNKKRSSVLWISQTYLNDTGSYECRLQSYHSSVVNVTVNFEPVTLEYPCPMEDSHSHYCLNGGTCFYYGGVGVPACRCKDDYQGERCENKVVSNHSSRYTYTCKLGLSTSYYC